MEGNIKVDNALIEILKKCANASGCLECQYADSTDCAGELSALALDLIRRQRAEIERLNHIQIELQAEIAVSRADVALVAHGRWIDKGEIFSEIHRYQCSECKKSSLFVELEHRRANYCSECGAKMDASDKDVGDNTEHCICCGDVIPEGRQVCPTCESEE